jgi:ADP-ribose pyrophosphatase YjhB (NUDIX family)
MSIVWKPHVTVAAVIENNQHFLLVQERDSGRTVYNQPAGHLEDGESLIAAVIRETLEETAWHFRPEALLGIYRWRQPGMAKTFLRIAFTGTCLSHEAGRTLDPDIERTVWMSVAEIRRQSQRLRSPLVIRSVDDYLAGITYPLSLLTDLE